MNITFKHPVISTDHLTFIFRLINAPVCSVSMAAWLLAQSRFSFTVSQLIQQASAL